MDSGTGMPHLSGTQVPGTSPPGCTAWSRQEDPDTHRCDAQALSHGLPPSLMPPSTAVASVPEHSTQGLPCRPGHRLVTPTEQGRHHLLVVTSPWDHLPQWSPSCPKVISPVWSPRPLVNSSHGHFPCDHPPLVITPPMVTYPLWSPTPRPSLPCGHLSTCGHLSLSSCQLP